MAISDTSRCNQRPSHMNQKAVILDGYTVAASISETSKSGGLMLPMKQLVCLKLF